MRPIRPFLDTCTWKKQSGASAWGPTFTSCTIECSISYVTRLVQTQDSNIITCNALVTCAEAVMPGDILTLTDPGTGEARDFPVKGLVKVANGINPEIPYRVVAL
jgi:hypothetical protein